MSISKKIEYYSRAGYPGLFIPTHEETRVCQEIVRGIENITLPADGSGKDRHPEIYQWSCTQGISLVGDNEGDPDMDDPYEVLNLFNTKARPGSVFILKDFHMFLEDASPPIIRILKDALESGKSAGKMLIIVGCRFVMPPEVEKLFTVVDFKLPMPTELADVVLDPLAESVGVELTTEERKELSEAGGGLTSYEFQDALALSYVESKNTRNEPKFCPQVVYREKVQTIKKSGLVEVVETNLNADDLGGLDIFKSWMQKRQRNFSQAAKDFGLKDPKGTLLVGVPGCGKSLSAKVSAIMLGGIPLLKLDLGKMFAGVVGASEENMRKVLELAEASAPCVLWIDEIERGLSGGESSGKTDGGTTDRMIGTLLNWMQDKTKPVFVFATGNDVTSLPPQLLRKGRFDELWFVDLPNVKEREEIFDIVIRRSGRDPSAYDLKAFSFATEGWTGSEIESLWDEALIEAFSASDNPVDPLDDDVISLSKETIPLSKSSSVKIEQMRKWAEAQARSATSPCSSKPKFAPLRSLN